MFRFFGWKIESMPNLNCFHESFFKITHMNELFWRWFGVLKNVQHIISHVLSVKSEFTDFLFSNFMLPFWKLDLIESKATYLPTRKAIENVLAQSCTIWLVSWPSIKLNQHNYHTFENLSNQFIASIIQNFWIRKKKKNDSNWLKLEQSYIGKSIFIDLKKWLKRLKSDLKCWKEYCYVVLQLFNIHLQNWSTQRTRFQKVLSLEIPLKLVFTRNIFHFQHAELCKPNTNKINESWRE